MKKDFIAIIPIKAESKEEAKRLIRDNFAIPEQPYDLIADITELAVMGDPAFKKLFKRKKIKAKKQKGIK